MAHLNKYSEFNSSLISRAGLEEVLSYQSYFNETNEFGGWSEVEGPTIPTCLLSERASDFVKACYGNNLVQPFDWGSWAEENRQLAHKGIGIQELNLEGIVKLLTCWIRADRFNSGWLLGVMRSGKIGQILNRLSEVT